jgi:hypothetical protein
MSTRITLLLSAGTLALAVGLAPIAIDPYPLHLKSKILWAHGGGGGGGGGGGAVKKLVN